jgi:sugar phosphate isomerase/epimerase
VPPPGETASPPTARDAEFENAAGKVDFKAVFAKLRSGGFNGPTMVEGVKVGATAEETTANAQANREVLERVLSSV